MKTSPAILKPYPLRENQKLPSQQHNQKYKTLLSYISNYDKDILEALGFDVSQDGSVKCCCPIHQGDNPTGFSYCPEKKTWRCWTHKCHEKYGAKIIVLVMALKSCDKYEAINWILEFNKERPALPIRQPPKEEPYKILDKNILESRHAYSTYFMRRGLTKTTIKEFHIFEDAKDHRAWIPIFNPSLDLVGFTGRKTNDLYPGPKWFHKYLKIRYNFFGLKQFTPRQETAILVEGPLDVMKLWQSGIRNSLGCFGCHLSDDQIKILMRYPVKNIITLFDPDPAGIEASTTIIERLSKFYNVYNLSDRLTTDPGETNEDYLRYLFKMDD